MIYTIVIVVISHVVTNESTMDDPVSQECPENDMTTYIGMRFGKQKLKECPEDLLRRQA
jgi:hypothetical protein